MRISRAAGALVRGPTSHPDRLAIVIAMVRWLNGSMDSATVYRAQGSNPDALALHRTSSRNDVLWVEHQLRKSE
jgi:hypothetical protein